MALSDVIKQELETHMNIKLGINYENTNNQNKS